MSRGAVNFHFGSKDDLLTAVAEEVTSDWEERAFRHQIPEGMDFAEGLGIMLDAQRGDLEADHDRFRIFAMLFFEALGPSPHLHEHFAGLHRRLRGRMVALLEGLQAAGQIRNDVDNEAFSAFVIGAFRGLTFQHLLDPDHVDIPAAYDEIRATILARLTD